MQNQNEAVTGGRTAARENTPGPWKVGPYVENDYEPAYFPVERDERDSGGFVKDVVPLIAKAIYGVTVEEKLANAKLIAAAPDLLAACEEMLAEAKERNRAAGSTVFNPAALDLARAAIAKAKEGR